MTRLTRDKIQKLLGSQVIGNYSSLTSIGKIKPNDNEPKNSQEAITNNSIIKDVQRKSVSNQLAKTDLPRSVTDPLVDKRIVSEPLATNKDVFISVQPIKTESSLLNWEIKTKTKTTAGEPLANGNETASKPLANKEVFGQTIAVFDAETKFSDVQTTMELPSYKETPTSNNIFINQNKSFIKTDLYLDEGFKIIKSHKEVSKPLASNSIFEIQSAHILAGKEFILVMYLIDLCQKNCSLITPPVFTNDLIKSVYVKPNHLRNIILRLCAKKIFKVLLHKSSRHAVRIFEFEKDTYVTLVGRKNNGKETNVLTNFQHNSIEKPINIAKDLDLTPLESIGFQETHIIQIYKEYEKNRNLELSKEMLQDSINAFAFDLKHNNTENSFRNSPAVVLLSLLKKGIPYSSKTPDKFLAPKEEAMKNYLEAKNKQIQTKKTIEDQLKKISFDEWFNGVKEEDLKEFYPDSSKLNGIPPKLKETLLKKEALKNIKDYFETNIWPKMQEKL